MSSWLLAFKLCRRPGDWWSQAECGSRGRPLQLVGTQNLHRVAEQDTEVTGLFSIRSSQPCQLLLALWLRQMVPALGRVLKQPYSHSYPLPVARPNCNSHRCSVPSAGPEGELLYCCHRIHQSNQGQVGESLNSQ